MKLKILFSFFILLVFNFGFGQVSSQQAVVGIETSTLSNYESHEKWLQESFGTYIQQNEIIEKRDANSKHFRNGDGTITALIAAGNINYQEGGQWKTIFHSIEQSSTGFTNIDNLFKTHYPLSSNGHIRTKLPNGFEFKDMLNMRMYFQTGTSQMEVKNISNSPGSSNFNQLTYENVYGQGIDLRLTQNTTHRKLDYLISSKNALGTIPNNAEWLVFEEKVELPNGWTAQIEGNTIEVKDVNGQVQFVFEKPVFKDSPVHTHNEELSGNADHTNCSADHNGHELIGNYELVQIGNLLTIKTKVPLSWMLAEGRTYPVIIDPTVNCVPDNVANWTGYHTTTSGSNTYTDGSANFTSTNITNSASDLMILGRFDYDKVYNSWMKFNINSVPDDACISSASVNYRISYNYSNDPPNCLVNVRMRNMSTDPSVAFSGPNNTARLSDIRDGDIYQTQNLAAGATGTGWRSVGLISNLFHLTNQLPLNWFAVGMNSYSGGPHISCYLESYGHSYSDKPYLAVTYIDLSVNLPNELALCNGSSIVVSPTIVSPAGQCNYSIRLYDTYGDGWHGNNFVNVSVAGTNVIANGTLSSGSGPATYNFSVSPGQAINVAYTSGSYPSECYYRVYDGPNGTGTMIFQSTVGSQPSANQSITNSCSASSPAIVYSWSPATGLSASNIANPTASPSTTTTYTLTITSSGCSASDQVTVNVKQVTPPTSISGASTICNGDPITLSSVGGEVVNYPFTTNLNDVSVNALNLSGAGGSISGAGLSLTTGSSYTSAVSQVLNIDKYTITFEMRYDAAPDGTWRKIFGFEPVGTDRSPGIWKYPSSMQLHWRHDPGNTGISEAFTYTQGQYYQVVGVKNGANFYIYIDGNLVDQGIVANPKTSGAASLYFGGAPVTLRNFKIYDGALSWYSGSCGGTFVNYGPTAIVSPTVTTTYYLRTEGDCANSACVNATVTVNQPANPPTSISATNPLHPAYCHGNTVNLTSVGGTAAGGGIVDVWYENSCNTAVEETWSTSPLTNPGWWIGSTTINSANGILNVSSTGVDPMIYLGNLSINPNVYRYVQVRYRYVSGPTTPGMQVFFENGLGLAESRSQRGTMIMDGSWHYLNLDMSINYSNVNSGWIGGGTVTGLRFDFCENTGMVMEFDFFLVSENEMVSDQTNLILNPGDTYYPTSTTQYFTRKIDNCGATSCTSTNVNLPPLGTNLSLDGENETCLVNQMGWVHFYHTSGRLIASVNSGGQNLGNVTITSYVEGAPASVPACDYPLNADYITAYMQRHWVVTPQFQPATPVQVKLPFSNVEFSNLVGVANTNPNGNDDLLLPNDLKLTKYSGPLNVNDDAVDNCPSNGGSGGATIHNQTGTNVTTLYSSVTSAQYAEYPVPSFSELWLHGSLLNSPLPVELVSFIAVCEENGNEVNVHWTTASENNSSHFTVERSFDGMSWELLGTVNAAGNSTSNLNYEMIDSDVRAHAVIYYRLNQYDLDGALKVYGPISAECLNNQIGFEVFPNPAGNEVTVLLHGEHQEGETSLHITDINGKEVKTILYNEQIGKLIAIDLRNLEQGVYIVRLVNGNEKDQFVRLIKQ